MRYEVLSGLVLLLSLSLGVWMCGSVARVPCASCGGVCGVPCGVPLLWAWTPSALAAGLVPEAVVLLVLLWKVV